MTHSILLTRRCRHRWLQRQLVVAACTVAANLFLNGCQPVEQPTPHSDSKTVTAPGWWTERRSGAPRDGLTDEQRETARQLASAGYVGGSMDATTDDVITIHDQQRAWAGLNLYNSGHAPEAFLIDMDGNELHRWRCTLADAWPRGPLDQIPESNKDWWRRVHLFENGDLLAIFEGVRLIKLDRDSNLLWSVTVGAHHDLEVMPDGSIYVLSQMVHVAPTVHPTEPTIEDLVMVLNSEGRVQKRFSLLNAFERAGFNFSTPEGSEHKPDIFHTNTLQVLDGSISDQLPEFAAGNVLVSVRTIDRIAVVDLDVPKVIWTQTGTFKQQHDSKILDNGNLLLFDNQGRPQQSAVIEYNPATMQVVWEYRGDQQHPFYSEFCGVAQRLPNGNTLVTESDYGRVFELTSGGEIVWEFHNPHRTGEDDRYIATIPELVRLPDDFAEDWLD